jgi:hypothetical protein
MTSIESKESGGTDVLHFVVHKDHEEPFDDDEVTRS